MRRIKAQGWFLFRVLSVVALVVLAKLIAHALGWEIITVNALFSGIIAANVFMMGFLLSGVLADYKEAEKIPGELGACLENMAQEARGIAVGKPEKSIGPCLSAIEDTTHGILDWLYDRIDIEDLLTKVDGLTVCFAELEPRTEIAYITRLKAEQSTLRRTLLRMDTIRTTSFVAAGYMLANVMTFILCVGLALSNLEPFHESLISSGAIAFLLVFMLTLIRDLDNPFGYDMRFSGADVSLQPLLKASERLGRMAGVRKGQRYRTRDDMSILYLTHWNTPFTGGGKGVLPSGTMVTVAADPPAGATAVYCDPDGGRDLERALVPESERSDAKYAGFSLAIDLEALRKRCDLVVS
jgi:hypothetical protein